MCLVCAQVGLCVGHVHTKRQARRPSGALPWCRCSACELPAGAASASPTATLRSLLCDPRMPPAHIRHGLGAALA